MSSKVKNIAVDYVVNEDDEILYNNCDAQWYSILKNFPWENYRELGASYYNALYEFNISKQLKAKNSPKNKETKDAGRQRLLFNRTTVVGHRNVNKMIMKNLLGLSFEEGYQVEHKHNCLYVYAPKIRKIFFRRIGNPGTIIELEPGYKKID